jgi:hypothetical protein
MIKIRNSDLKEALEEHLDRKATKVELKGFVDWVENDLGQFIEDNVHSYVQDKLMTWEAIME